jgi:hypothetical protein
VKKGPGDLMMKLVEKALSQLRPAGLAAEQASGCAQVLDRIFSDYKP